MLDFFFPNKLYILLLYFSLIKIHITQMYVLNYRRFINYNYCWNSTFGPEIYMYKSFITISGSGNVRYGNLVNIRYKNTLAPNIKLAECKVRH